MLGQAMQTQFAIFPFIMLLMIGLAMLFAVTIVVVSLIKAGKGTGVVVVFIALTLCGLFLAGLLVPMAYRQRSIANMQEMHAWAEARSAPAPVVAPEMHPWVTPPPAPLHVLPQQLNDTTAPPMERQVAPATPATAEVSSEAEITTEAAASPGDESSASKNEANEWTESQASDSASTSPSQLEATAPPKWTTEPEGPMADGTYVIPVRIGEFSSAEEIQSELLPSIRSALNSYMAQFIDHQAPALIQLPPGYVVDHGIVADRWNGIRNDSLAGAPMHSMWLKLRFDANVRRDLQARFEQAKVTHRLGAFGLGGGLLLALLGTLYGYLKLDTVTKGFYSGRLRLAAVLTGLSAAGAAAGLVAERVVMWV